jgi:hypothetical protein
MNTQPRITQEDSMRFGDMAAIPERNQKVYLVTKDAARILHQRLHNPGRDFGGYIISG